MVRSEAVALRGRALSKFRSFEILVQPTTTMILGSMASRAHRSQSHSCGRRNPSDLNYFFRRLAKPTGARGRGVPSFDLSISSDGLACLASCLATPPDPLPLGPALGRIGDFRRLWKVQPLMRSGISRRSPEWSGGISKRFRNEDQSQSQTC